MSDTASPAGHSVATESAAPEGRPCPFCGQPVPPQEVRRGQPKTYCSEACQKRAWNATHPRVGQRIINWNPPARPEAIQGEQQRKLRSELGRRLFQKRALLLRLQEGPALRHEMKAFGGDRFSARVNELRAAGHRIIGPVPAPKHGIFATTEPAPNGEDVYLLRAEDGCL